MKKYLGGVALQSIIFFFFEIYVAIVSHSLILEASEKLRYEAFTAWIFTAVIVLLIQSVYYINISEEKEVQRDYIIEKLEKIHKRINNMEHIPNPEFWNISDSELNMISERIFSGNQKSEQADFETGFRYYRTILSKKYSSIVREFSTSSESGI